MPTDVSDEADVAALARAAGDRFGRIDAWINNAGVMAYGRFDEVPMEWHRQVVATNLLGPMSGAAEALRRFRVQERGVLVNVASLYAEMTTPFVSSYVTSKFGLLGFSRVLQRDLVPADGIPVCAVLPSSIDTPIFQHAGNYTGNEVFPIPPVVDLDRVVRSILRSIDEPRPEVTVGVIGRLLALGHTGAPAIYRRLVVPVMEHLGFGDESRPAEPGNVFIPAPPFDQQRGGWHEPRRRRQALAKLATLPAKLVRG